MSIVSSPTPLQNSLMPAPEPPEFDDRRLEVGEGLAEALGDDLGVWQHGGRAGDLDLVARGGGAGGKANGKGCRRGGEKKFVHGACSCSDGFRVVFSNSDGAREQSVASGPDAKVQRQARQ